MFKQMMFKIARSKISSLFIGSAFQHFSGLIPVKKIFVDEDIFVFNHPVPYWQFHILAVPKRAIPSLLEMNFNLKDNHDLILKLMSILQKIAWNKKLVNFKIIVNGGDYQDVPQLHFHLASDMSKGMQEPAYRWGLANEDCEINSYRSAIIYKHPCPVRENHYLITSDRQLPLFTQLDFNNQYHQSVLIDILSLAQITVSNLRLKAFSLLTEITLGEPDPKVCFHLVSGNTKSN